MRVFSITSDKKQPWTGLEFVCLYKICHNSKWLDFLQYLIKINYIWNETTRCKIQWASLAFSFVSSPAGRNASLEGEGWSDGYLYMVCQGMDKGHRKK